MKINSIYKNCLNVLNTEEGDIPVRFTQRQLELYSSKTDYCRRSLCPAGICIDVLTDSKEISIDYSVKGKARDYIFFDFYLNGKYYQTKGSRPIDINTKAVLFNIPDIGEKMNRIAIYLPHNIQLLIKKVSFLDGTTVKSAPDYSGNLLCMGDSITQGMEAIHPSSTYPVLLSRFLEMNLLNQGVGGEVFNPDILDNELPMKPEIITVAYGTNDWNSCESMSNFKQNCSEYIRKLCRIYPHICKLIITPFWRHNMQETKCVGTLQDVSIAIKEICVDYSEVYLVDGLEIAPNIIDYYADGLHPTDEDFCILQ